MSNERNPGTAAVLSFVFTGLGQLYNGQLFKGLMIIFISSLNMVIFILGAILIGFWMFRKVIFVSQAVWGLVLFGLGIFFISLISIYSIFDAYKVASKK